MKIPRKIIVIVTIVIASLTRLIALNSIPPHLSNDEISIAYDAYSISKTLRDEHNQFLPISFQSHNTYKAPLTIYLAVIPTVIFGNSEYSVRITSAILGILTISILGFFVYELTKNINLSVTTAFLLAITPWHIYTSRMALESNIALFFVIAGLYLSFYGINHNSKRSTFIGFVSFALSMYAYHTEWILTPMLIGILYLNFRKSLISKKYVWWGYLIFILLIYPLFINFVHNLGTNARANTELIFADSRIRQGLSDMNPNPLGKVQIILSAFLGGYSLYTNFGLIFFNGLRLIQSPDPFQVGLFLTPFLPCFIIGVFTLKKYFKENTKFIYLWLIISPIVPALTQGGFNAVRNLATVAPYTIMIGAGCLELLSYFKKKKFILYLWTITTVISFFYFLAIYFYHFPKENGENFQYGYKQIAVYIKDNYSKYNKIVIDPKFGEGYVYDGVPHLYISYFTYLDPHYLQNRMGSKGLIFDKYEIKSIKWSEETILPNTLYAVPYSNRPSDGSNKFLRLLKEIDLPNSRKAFALYGTSEVY